MKTRPLILVAMLFVCLISFTAQAFTDKQVTGVWRVQQVNGKDSLSSANSAMSLFFLNQRFYECRFSGGSVTLLDKDGNVVDKSAFTTEQQPNESFIRIHIEDEGETATWLLKDDMLEIRNQDLTITLKKL